MLTERDPATFMPLTGAVVEQAGPVREAQVKELPDHVRAGPGAAGAVDDGPGDAVPGPAGSGGAGRGGQRPRRSGWNLPGDMLMLPGTAALPSAAQPCFCGMPASLAMQGGPRYPHLPIAQPITLRSDY